MFKVSGNFRAKKPPLDAKTHGEDEDCGSYIRRKVSFQVQLPRATRHLSKAIACRAGCLCPKQIGQAGACPRSFASTARPPARARTSPSAFPAARPARRRCAIWHSPIDMAEAGFVALAPDYLRDGERIKPGRRPYDTTDFYKEFPDWSIHGKDAWDTMRAIDYLETLDFVDPEKIGMIGHSYGGHSTIFAAALEPRIKVAVANGPVSDFLHHGMHWAVPKGGGAASRCPRCGRTCSITRCRCR